MLQQNLSPLSRALLIGSFVIYIAQLLSGGLLTSLLSWQQLGAGFQPWQPFTSFLLSGPDPTGAIFGWIGIFFFVAPVQSILGTRKLGYAMLATWAGVVVSTLGLLALGLHFDPFLGSEPLLLALCCLFGFYMPGQNILLAFVLPIRGLWFAWGSGLFALLWLVFSPGNRTWMDVAAWCSAFVFQYVDQGGLRRLRVKQQRRTVERRFAVHQGGKSSSTKWDN
jgi:hypothetical protein